MANADWVKVVTQFQALICSLWLSAQGCSACLAGYTLYFQQPRQYEDAVYAMTAFVMLLIMIALIRVVIIWCRITTASIQIAEQTWPDCPSFRIFKDAIKAREFGDQLLFTSFLDWPRGRFLVISLVAAAACLFVPHVIALINTAFIWLETVMAITMFFIGAQVALRDRSQT